MTDRLYDGQTNRFVCRNGHPLATGTSWCHECDRRQDADAREMVELAAKQRFLGALDAFIGVRIEQHERHGQTVPTSIVDRWQASGANLAVALDNLMETCRG